MDMDDSLLLKLMEEFVYEIRSGHAPDPEAYAVLYPHFAERIREIFPTLLLLENAASIHPDPPHRKAGLGSDAIFGPYRILREIGRGGMGIVYEAVRVSTRRHVALKILPLQFPVDAARLERFLREASITSSLRHPNIIPIFDVGAIDQTAYFAMRHIDGRGLDRVLRILQQKTEAEKTPALKIGKQEFLLSNNGMEVAGHSDPVSEAAHRIRAGVPVLFEDYLEWVVQIAVQAASGLAYAHRHRLIHRDIKPSNLLLDRKGTLWIADFGLARKIGDPALTATGVILGTPRYMSPEQAATAAGQMDHRSDLYSLGVTIYELLTCRPVFEGETPQEILGQILAREPVAPRRLNPSIPVDLERVVMRAMAKKPEDRYQSAGELEEDLRHWAQKIPVRARKETWTPLSLRWFRRNFKVVATVLPLIAALLVLGGLYYREKSRNISASDMRISDAADSPVPPLEDVEEIHPEYLDAAPPSYAESERRPEEPYQAPPASEAIPAPGSKSHDAIGENSENPARVENRDSIRRNSGAKASRATPGDSFGESESKSRTLPAVLRNLLSGGRGRIRIGTAAPKNSLWHEALKELKQEWEEISGVTTVTIYEDGKLGDEMEMIEQVRAGRIQAAALSTVGLAQIDDALLCLQIPFMIHSYEELDYVLEHIGPNLEAKLEEKGFKLLFWTDAGWIRTFTREPVYTPDDLRKMKLFTLAGDPDTIRLYEDLGFNVVPLTMSDMIASLQTGMINAVNLPPYYVSMTGIQRIASYMTGIPWNPLVTGTVINLDIWNTFPAKTRDQLLAAARAVGAKYKDRIRISGEDAVKEMETRGLYVVHLAPAEAEAWRQEAQKAYPLIRGNLTPDVYFDEVYRLLLEYRASTP